MSKISIKIVEVHQPSQTVIVKFASDASQKPIDEYDGLAFSVPNYNSLTPDEFIKTISPQVSKLVTERDNSESLMDTLDVTSWNGYSVTIDSNDILTVDPAIETQIISALANPEVIL
jgi:hypothetical protein